MDSKTTNPVQQINAIRKFNVEVCAFTMQKPWKSSLTLCIIYTTQGPCMRDYLQDSKAHWHSDHFMCKFIRFTSLFHKFTALFRDSAR